MKIRNGFVSNSSSSSFICDVCGEEASGWDISLREANMYRCENGHTFCEEHAGEIDDNVFREEAIKVLEERGEEYDEDDIQDCMDDIESESRYEYPSSICPCCKFIKPTTIDMLTYLMKRCGLTQKLLTQEMQEAFKTYDEFKTWLEK